MKYLITESGSDNIIAIKPTKNAAERCVYMLLLAYDLRKIFTIEKVENTDKRLQGAMKK